MNRVECHSYAVPACTRMLTICTQDLSSITDDATTLAADIRFLSSLLAGTRDPGAIPSYTLLDTSRPLAHLANLLAIRSEWNLAVTGSIHKEGVDMAIVYSTSWQRHEKSGGLPAAPLPSSISLRRSAMSVEAVKIANA